MAKRLFDTDIWQKEWFGDLPTKHKLLVFYIFGNCDCAGVFEANYRNLKFYLGENITEADILAIKQIVKLPNGKFYLTDFIQFQYGVNAEELNPKFSVHKGVLKILEKNEIVDKEGTIADFGTVSKGIGNSCKTVEKSCQPAEKKEKKKIGEFKNILLSDDEISKLQELYKDKFSKAVETLSSYIASSGKKYKSHYAVLGKHNWVYKKIFGDTAGKDRNSILREVSEAF
jgi:hypothetical protein